MKKNRFHSCPTKILVVCYGNICRSPLVEGLLRQNLDPNRFEIQSCGFVEEASRPSPEIYAFYALREGGVDLYRHRSKVISEELINWADLVLLMDFRNWKDIKKFYPNVENKLLWLCAWSNNSKKEIPDPYGKGQDEMKGIIIQMRTATFSFLKDLDGSSFLPVEKQIYGSISHKEIFP
jgi:protein-tyrosine phosphatase